MRLQSADDLFLAEVQDLYDAEKQILRTLPRVARNAGNKELTTAFRDHVEETRTQINRLEEEKNMDRRLKQLSTQLFKEAQANSNGKPKPAARRQTNGNGRRS